MLWLAMLIVCLFIYLSNLPIYAMKREAGAADILEGNLQKLFTYLD